RRSRNSAASRSSGSRSEEEDGASMGRSLANESGIDRRTVCAARRTPASIVTCADHLAAIAGRDGLVDSPAANPRFLGGTRGVEGQAGGKEGRRIRWPATDRILEEPDGAVHEREVRASGVHARRAEKEGGLPIVASIVGIPVGGQAVHSPEWVHGIQCTEQGITIVSRIPPVIPQ